MKILHIKSLLAWQLCLASDVVVLSVKPQVMTEVLADLKQFVQPRHLVVSIAAGTIISRIAEELLH